MIEKNSFMEIAIIDNGFLIKYQSYKGYSDGRIFRSNIKHLYVKTNSEVIDEISRILKSKEDMEEYSRKTKEKSKNERCLMEDKKTFKYGKMKKYRRIWVQGYYIETKNIGENGKKIRKWRNAHWRKIKNG